MFHFKRIQNWKELVDLIEEPQPNYPSFTANYIQYRGQSNKDWKLESSLLRIVKGDSLSEEKAKYYEAEAQMEFGGKVHILEQKFSYTHPNPIAMYVDMQHYSCPTRLLDWTSSPYIGLYFAVNDSFDKDGALFTWDSRNYVRKMKLLNRSSTISPDEILTFTEYDFLTIIFASKRNERLSKQQGAFSISNNPIKSHCDIIKETFERDEPSGLYKIEIPKELKFEFLSRLKIMNITAESLFPGLDGLGKSIREQMFLRKWGRV